MQISKESILGIAAFCLSLAAGEPARADEPLGCSAHLGGLIGHERLTQYISLFHLHIGNLKFESACVTHDLCYRHGYVTYGKSRKECDDAFNEDMQRICDRLTLNDFLSLGFTYNACHAARKEYYAGVRELAGDSFRIESSLFRQYAGMETVELYSVKCPPVIGHSG